MLQKLNNSINKIENSNCLLGDFNFRKRDWSKGEGNSQLGKSFIDILNQNVSVQMVDKPTRGNNILDLVCISDPSCIVEVEESFALIDHKSIKVLLRCPVVRITSQSRKVYLYSKANDEAINKEIKHIDWTKEYNNESKSNLKRQTTDCLKGGKIAL